MAGSLRLLKDTLVLIDWHQDHTSMWSLTRYTTVCKNALLTLEVLPLAALALQPATPAIHTVTHACSVNHHSSYQHTSSCKLESRLLHSTAVEQPWSIPSKARQTISMDTSKLRCQEPSKQGVVLLSCGSFNPPTVMHMRMFDLAADALSQANQEVWGGYLSPVGDAYGKPGLAPAMQRVAMCEAAAASHPFVTCDAWEASQPQYTRTLAVLRHFQEQLDVWWESGGRPQGASSETSHPKSEAPATPSPDSAATAAGNMRQGDCQQAPRVLLLCGADVLLSMTIPGVWEHPEQLLEEFGVVCVERSTSNKAAGTTNRSNNVLPLPHEQRKSSQQSLDEPLGLQVARAQQSTSTISSGHAQDQGVAAQLGEAPSALQQAMQQQDGLLKKFHTRIHVLMDPVPNSISSTIVRQEWAAGRSVRYLVPDAVLLVMQQANPSLYI